MFFFFNQFKFYKIPIEIPQSISSGHKANIVRQLFYTISFNFFGFRFSLSFG